MLGKIQTLWLCQHYRWMVSYLGYITGYNYMYTSATFSNMVCCLIWECSGVHKLVAEKWLPAPPPPPRVNGWWLQQVGWLTGVLHLGYHQGGGEGKGWVPRIQGPFISSHTTTTPVTYAIYGKSFSCHTECLNVCRIIFLPSCLPACLPASLLVYLHACLLVFLSICLPTC